MVYSVSVIYSSSTIDSIKNTIHRFVPWETKFHVRPMNTFDRESKKLRDNHMNLLFFDSELPDEVLKKIEKEIGSSLSSFNWDFFKMPGQNESSNLHVRGFPRTMDKKTATSIIEENLKFLGLTENDYKISMSLLDRCSNIIRGDGTIYFGEHVPEDTRKFARVMLDKTILTENERVFIFCKWQRTSNIQLPSIRSAHKNIGSPNRKLQFEAQMPLASELHSELQSSSMESKFGED